MIDVTQLKTCAAAFEVEVDDLLAQRLDIYARLLVEWNEKMNLTAITEPNAIVIKHFVDSLTVSRYLPEGPVALVDVGTGAGFPGVPLALYRDDIQLTLLDSLNKRLLFLKEVCTALGLPATLVHARAEEAGRQPAYRERFDVATARAVAALPTLCEYCLPLVKPHGRVYCHEGTGRGPGREKGPGGHTPFGRRTCTDRFPFAAGANRRRTRRTAAADDRQNTSYTDKISPPLYKNRQATPLTSRKRHSYSDITTAKNVVC